MTTQAAPQTIFDGLMSEVTEALFDNKKLSDFEIRQLEHRVGKLTGVDVAGALELKGYLKAIAGDLAGANEFFSRSLKASGGHPGTIVRYIQMLACTGQSDLTMKVFSDFKGALVGDVNACRHVAKSLGLAGWVLSSKRFLDELASKGQIPTGLVADTESVCLGDYEEADVAQAVGFSHGHFRQLGVPAKGTKAMAVPDKGGMGRLLVEFVIDRSPEEVAEIEWDFFAEVGAQRFPIECAGVLSFVLTPFARDNHANIDC